MEARKSPVHRFAEEAGVPVFVPKTLRRVNVQNEFTALGADVAIVVAYGLILPKVILDAPPLGCLNLHGSLLPRWRGAAPIQRAIMAGDTETGVMVMKMDEGLDTGPVALADRLSIGPDSTAGEIHDHLALMGASLMLRALTHLEKRELTFTPQPLEGVTYAAKISKEETRIDWSKPAPDVHDMIRGLSPYPGAWFEALLGGKAERVKVLRSVVVPGKGEPGLLLDAHLTVACGGSQAVRLTQVQRAGRRPVGGAEFLRGFPLARGTHFG
jgi:methionyl-tRNA formyltransferase